MRFILVVLLLPACFDRTVAHVSPEQGRVESFEIPVTPNRDIDILFVIDDSPSMLDKQNNLKANFPTFINVLEAIDGGLPNVHIGVVTSDMGTKGADDPAAGPSIGGGMGSCSGTGRSGNLMTNGTTLLSGTFISDIKNTDGSRTKNYAGALADVFSAIASVGAGGCGFEQHLEAAKRALGNNPANAGFLRPNAYLGLIFIQDEDDCSLAHSSLLASDTSQLGPLQSFRCTRQGITCSTGGTSPVQMNVVGAKSGCASNESSAYLTKIAPYVSFFNGLKTQQDLVIVAGIAGPTTPFEVELRVPPGGGNAIPALAHSCSYSGANGTEVADPPVRLKQFLDAFPTSTTFSTICQTNLSGPLKQIAELFALKLGDACVKGQLTDVDPNTPGPQYECAVSDVTNFGKANAAETVLPECNNLLTPPASTNKPCWAIEPDPVYCPKSIDNLALKVERDIEPPPDVYIHGGCVTNALPQP